MVTSCTIGARIDVVHKVFSLVYTPYYLGQFELFKHVLCFVSYICFVPLLYRSGAATSNTAMAVADDTIVTDYYYNAEKWKTIND